MGWLEWPSCGQCVVIETIETCLTLGTRACESTSTSTIVVGFLGRPLWLAWWDSDSQSFGVIVQEVRGDTRIHPRTLDALSLGTHSPVLGCREDLCSTGWISVPTCALFRVALGGDQCTATHGQWALMSRQSTACSPQQYPHPLSPAQLSTPAVSLFQEEPGRDSVV